MQAELLDFTTSDSPIHRLDARWRLVGISVACLAVVSLQSAAAAAAALALALLALRLARLPWRWFGLRLASVGLFLSLFLVVVPFTVQGDGFPVGPLHVSWRGLHLAGLICCKVLAVTALVLLLLASGPVEATLRAAHRLWAPGLLVQLLMLTHRYVHLFGEELGKLRIALRLRRFRNRMSRHAYRTIGNVTGTLLVRSYERAERVGQAMRARAFSGKFHSLHTSHTTIWDVLGCGLLLLTGVLPLAIDLGLRWPIFG